MTAREVHHEPSDQSRGSISPGRPVPAHPFAGDDGTADQTVTVALGAYAQGVATGGEVLEALAASRVLVPVVAVLDDVEIGPQELRRDKESTMATVTVQRPDGGKVQLAFTGLASLRAWRQDARPVPVPARAAAQAALGVGADALLVDVAGPQPFVVDGAALRSLAFAQHAGTALPEDPDVAVAVRACLAGEPDVAGALLSEPIPGDDGAEPPGLRITLVVNPALGPERFRALVPRVSHAFAGDLVLRSRVYGGLQIAVVPPGQEPAGATQVMRR